MIVATPLWSKKVAVFHRCRSVRRPFDRGNVCASGALAISVVVKLHFAKRSRSVSLEKPVRGAEAGPRARSADNDGCLARSLETEAGRESSR